MARERPSLKLRHGDNGLEKCVQDMAWHIAHLRTAAAYGCPDLFGAYLKWAQELFHGLGFDPADIFHTLTTLRDVLLEELDREDRAAPLAILNDAIQDFPGQGGGGASLIDASAPFGKLAAMFLDALLSTRWTEAAALARTVLDDGLSLTDLHVHAIQPALREIGRLWQIRRIGVEQEHMATAITMGVLARLKSDRPAPTPDAPALVAACVEGELHDIGLRMVADRYEREGWRVLYLGANTPIGAVVAAVIEARANALALSATMTPHLEQVVRTIGAVRADTRSQTTSILVGGQPFVIAPDIWRKIGADASATDASSVPFWSV
jgi:methanogenic corrinoid protein MtbC1